MDGLIPASHITIQEICRASVREPGRERCTAQIAQKKGSPMRGFWRRILIGFLSLFTAALAAACENPDAQGPTEASWEDALVALDTIELVGHIQTLASDAYMGRAPASPGERQTMDYLEEEFLAMGLQPGGENGMFTQEVPLVSITPDPDMTLLVRDPGWNHEFSYGTEFVATTPEARESSSLDGSELVFVGYGIVAPEYDWNDYANVDVEGKTVVALVNDPGFITKDPDFFQGNAMTYYGRWTYKYEEAGRQGAAGILLIHETEPAAYPWATVENGWTGPQFVLADSEGRTPRTDVEGWISYPTASEIFSRAGMDLDEMKARAIQPGFQAVPMGLTASVEVRNTLERSVSHNFLARLDGSLRPEEVILYMGHWDHFGIDPTLEGDTILNGAVDNASGIAAMLEIAEAFTRLDPPPQRSIVFMATTAEEQGLLGSEYYAANPVYPLDETVAAINIDALPIWGPTHDYVIVGYGKSELDEYARTAAEAGDRVVKPNPEPEKGSFFRSDHFPLAKRGVPAHYGGAGFDIVGRGEEYGRAQSDAWTQEHYHQPSDEYSDDWALGGALQDMRLWFRMGVDLGYSSNFPNWYEGTEFKAARDAMFQEGN